LQQATTMTDDQRREFGLRGRSYVARELSWQRVAGEMSAVYRWTLEGGKPPGCVVIS